MSGLFEPEFDRLSYAKFTNSQWENPILKILLAAALNHVAEKERFLI